MRNTIGLLFFYMTRIFGRTASWFWNWTISSFLKKRAKSAGSVRVNGFGRFMNVQGLQIGDNVHINIGAYWVCDGGLFVGDHTHIAKNCTIYTRNHNYNGTALPYDDTNIFRPVKIGESVWIGANVTILPGAQIGEGSIIGAGSVVHGEIPAFSIVGAPGPNQISKRDLEHYDELAKNKKYGGAGGRPLLKPES